jgi:cytochrome b561
VPDEVAATWTRAQRGLHWWTAALIFFALPLGFLMVAMPLGQLLAKFLLYQLHKSIGITVVLLVAARLLLRLRRGRPLWEPALPPAQQRLAATAHASLYVLMIVTPILGYLTAATAPAQVPTLFWLLVNVPHVLSTNANWYPVLRAMHRAAAILLVALAVGHAGAAVLHHLRGRDTLARMWRGASGRSSGISRRRKEAGILTDT